MIPSNGSLIEEPGISNVGCSGCCDILAIDLRCTEGEVSGVGRVGGNQDISSEGCDILSVEYGVLISTIGLL